MALVRSQPAYVLYPSDKDNRIHEGKDNETLTIGPMVIHLAC